MIYPQLTEQENQTLLSLCRDDGYTIVTQDLRVQTANMSAPNLGAILDVLQGCKAMMGRDVNFEEVPQKTINDWLSKLGGHALHNEPVEDESEKRNSVDKQLRALCQTAVDEDSSDIHMMVMRDSTLFLLRTNGTRRLIRRFHNGKSAQNQPRDMGLALINYVFSSLGGQDVKITRPANDRFSLTLKVDGQSRDFEWRAALIPLSDGAKLTLRSLTPKNKALTLEDMDLPTPYLSTLVSMMNKRQGAIVITGAMG
ncbi:ATPase, T2SS/T4P/T4SS family, partial [uncultured Vibrio sp.]